MIKTALNKNIIPHTWKLANIVPIPKLNKDIYKGTSYSPRSLLSVIAKTLEKSLLPYITSNIPNTPTQYGYKTQHSTVTTLHTLNNTVAKGFNQMAPPARTITVALDMNKAFDTINIHTLIRKLLQTNIPVTILMFIANYIKGCKAYTTYRNHISRQIQFKTAIHKAATFHQHYLTFTPQTYHSPVYRFMSWPTQMTSPSHPHTHTHECSLIKFFSWTKQNNLILNPDKTTCTLFTPVEYTSNLDLKYTTKHYPWQGTQRFWVLPQTKN